MFPGQACWVESSDDEELSEWEPAEGRAAYLVAAGVANVAAAVLVAAVIPAVADPTPVGVVVVAAAVVAVAAPAVAVASAVAVRRRVADLCQSHRGAAADFAVLSLVAEAALRVAAAA